MNLYLKTLIVDNDMLKKHIQSSHLYNLGFECDFIDFDERRILEWLSQNKTDIVVLGAEGQDDERLNFLLETIYNNFCSNVIVIKDNYDSAKYSVVCSHQDKNFDLKLVMALLNIKKQIETKPSRNEGVLRSKICELLCNFMFSSKHDGFNYYVDAIMKAYSCFPFRYSTMEIYKEVAKSYNKTVCAVEKSMRNALYNAYSKLKDAPVTSDNMKLKSYLTYDMNNNMAISMLVSRLVLDKEINLDAPTREVATII